MTSGTIARILITMGLFCVALSLQANELALRIELDGTRPARIVIDSDLDSEGWLGVSWYAFGVTDSYSQGEHQVIHLAKGKSQQVFRVPERLLGGSIECALWKEKVFRNECATKCQWCLDNGFHLAGQQAYIYGSLAEAAQ